MDGQGIAPRSALVAIVCRRFHCVPSVALQELDEHPTGWIDEVMEADAYMEAKAMVDAATDTKYLPKSSWIDKVHEIEFALVREELASTKDE